MSKWPPVRSGVSVWTSQDTFHVNIFVVGVKGSGFRV